MVFNARRLGPYSWTFVDIHELSPGLQTLAGYASKLSFAFYSWWNIRNGPLFFSLFSSMSDNNMTTRDQDYQSDALTKGSLVENEYVYGISFCIVTELRCIIASSNLNFDAFTH
jgi:hypothetical protein